MGTRCGNAEVCRQGREERDVPCESFFEGRSLTVMAVLEEQGLASSGPKHEKRKQAES